VSSDTLSTYLNDHLAGSIGAIELLDRVIAENDGNPLGQGLADLLSEIRRDQAVVSDLIARLGATENRLKKTGAWLAEKAGRVKLGGSELARMEVLETLAMGIHGKRGLWRALRTVADRHPVLRGLDLDLLERRAVEQHDRVEAWRLEAAREVL
jgi:hypothetical protein